MLETQHNPNLRKKLKDGMFEYYNYLVYNIRTDTNITMSFSVWRKFYGARL